MLRSLSRSPLQARPSNQLEASTLAPTGLASTSSCVPRESTPPRRTARSPGAALSVIAKAVLPIGLAALAGCHAVGPDYKQPATTMPSGFGEPMPLSRRFGPPSPAQERAAELGLWWQSFNDPELNSLIDRAVQRNLTLQEATERILQARANTRLVAASLLPSINGIGAYTHEKSSSNGGFVGGGAGASSGSTSSSGTTAGSGGGSGTTSGTGSTSGSSSTSGSFSNKPVDLYEVGFDATWELDVFGGIRRQVEAANDDTQAAIEDRRDTLVTLLGEVANNYLALRGAQKQLAITQQNLKSQQDTLTLTQTRFKAGLTSDLDVANAEAQVATTAAALPGYETTVRTSIFSLSILLAQDPEGLSQELSNDSPIPTAVPNVPVGIPSELLRRRPDVRRAERQLAAATANIGVATADLFPSFSLTGETGLQSLQLKRLLRGSSWFYSVGPSMNWNLFDAGAIRANIDIQNSLQRQALATYKQTVLQALSDVDSALVTYDQEQTKRLSLAQAVQANQRAVDLSVQLYTRGLLDFLSVLDAQRSLFAAQSALVQSDQNVSSDLVALYKALGGGWQTGM
jgi:NodT family efflux transporter outer membrane factor (OMF) lipoprotein